MKTYRLAVFLSVLWPGVLLHASSIVIGGPAGTLAPSSGAWSWDGPNLAAYEAAITNPANFGPSGTVPISISTTTLNTVDSASLAGLNVFVAPWWFNVDSAPYNAAVENYFLSGGNLILLDDDPFTDGIAADLGFSTSASDGSVSNGGSPLFDGPFGTASNVTQSADVGQIDTTNLAAHGAFICATNASGQATAVCDPAGAYAAGSGALLILGDVDMWSTAYGTVSYSPLNDNGIFALNGTAWIAGQSTAPEPATFALIGFGLLALGVKKRL